jgi:hypothetical protein
MSRKQLLNRLAAPRRTDCREAHDVTTPRWLRDELLDAWKAAQDEATASYRTWCACPDMDAYATYRAAQDRADAAQDALAAAAGKAKGPRLVTAVSQEHDKRREP